MPGQQTQLGVAMLRRAVDALIGIETGGLTGPELTTLLEQVEVQRRRLEALDAALVAEVDRQGTAGEFGRQGSAALLSSLLRITPSEARLRVERAREVGPRRGLTGEPLEPLMPATADALGAGELSGGHVAVIADCLDALSPALSVSGCAAAEGFLLEAARHEHPGQLRKTAALLIARLDPDGVEPREEEAARDRAFGLRKFRDGTSAPTGRFDAETTAMWDAVLDSLAAPQSSPEGEADTRTAAQRRHDAVADVLARALRSGELPDAGGVPVTVLIRTTLEELRSGEGVGITSHGIVLSISKILQMSGDAQLLAALCSDTGGILSYGRTRRLASTGQRLALAVRDGGCAFPGCDRPPAWTEAHHIIAWIPNGPTDIDNMCLLCRYHHRHFEALGWEVFMHEGMPTWRPPAWIDPERKPIRNTTHHLDDIPFARAG